MGFLLVIPQIIQFLIMIPGLIKAFKDIFDLIKGIDNPKEKKAATAEFDAIKRVILEDKIVSADLRDRIKAFRDRLAAQK